LAGVDGLHIHALCEQGFEPLARIWTAVEPHLAPLLGGIKWLNLGGGHHITRADYDREALVAWLAQVSKRHGVQIYLEPGEAIALDAGLLVGEILDTFDNGLAVGITDISATCHMPDVIEAPYRPAMLGEVENGVSIRLGGPSCLAGDIIGDYGFAALPDPGTRIAFLDQAHYSMVKTNTFNGVPCRRLRFGTARPTHSKSCANLTILISETVFPDQGRWRRTAWRSASAQSKCTGLNFCATNRAIWSL
jgi:carboxynorspermidine decarboxylase